MLEQIQRDLFALGALLADPRAPHRGARRRRPRSAPETSRGSSGGSTRSTPSAAAAAAVHPRRRIAGRRRAAPRAHRLPPRRARASSRSARRRRRRRSELAHLHQPPVGPAVRHGARGERPRRRAGNRVVSAEPRRLRATACGWRGSTTRIFPSRRGCCRARMRPHIAAIYAFARIADDFADEGDRPVGATRLALLDDWERRLDARRARRRGRRAADRARDVFVALRRHDARRAACRRAASHDLLSAFRQDVTVDALRRPGTTLLDYCRRSANPVGRLVLRVAGYRDPALDAASDARLHGAAADEFLAGPRDRLAKGRLYVPRADLRRRLAPTSADLERRRHDAGVARARWRTSSARTRALFDAGRPVADGVRGRLRWELRATWLGGVADPRSARARADFDVFRARPTLGASDALPHRLAASLTWRPTARDAEDQLLLLVSRAAAPTSAARSPPSSTSAARWTTRRLEADGEQARGRASTRWRDEIARVFDGGAPATPQGRALQPFVAPFHLPRAAVRGADRRRRDGRRPRRYATFADLEPYCIRVASAVGLICAEIFGYREPRSRRVRARSRRRAAADEHPARRRGRSRARPRSTFRSRISRASAAARRTSRARSAQRRPRRAVRGRQARCSSIQAARARVFFARADARAAARATRAVSSPPRSCARSTAAILGRIEAADFDVFTRVIRVPRPRRALIAARPGRRRRSGRDEPTRRRVPEQR